MKVAAPIFFVIGLGLLGGSWAWYYYQVQMNHAPTMYAYSSLDALLEGESRGGAKSPLPEQSGGTRIPVTERPGA